MCDHIHRLVSEGPSALAQFQAPLTRMNCPATAHVVFRYLSSGQVSQAGRLMGDGMGGMVECSFRPAPLSDIIDIVRRGGDCFHVVVGAHGPDREHYFNLVNSGGVVYYIDAYTRPGVITTEVSAYTSWARQFEYTATYNPQFVPAGATPRPCR